MSGLPGSRPPPGVQQNDLISYLVLKHLKAADANQDCSNLLAETSWAPFVYAPGQYRKHVDVLQDVEYVLGMLDEPALNRIQDYLLQKDIPEPSDQDLSSLISGSQARTLTRYYTHEIVNEVVPFKTNARILDKMFSSTCSTRTHHLTEPEVMIDPLTLPFDLI